MNFCDLMISIGNRAGVYDIACPICGPRRRSPINRSRKVLRVWNTCPGFVTFHCARCGQSGFACDSDVPASNIEVRADISRQSAEWDRKAKAIQLSKALALWRGRQPLRGSLGETYLREARGYHGRIPSTLGFLPVRDEFLPAMIGVFGMSEEFEPNALMLPESRVAGVHLTRLLPDGSDRVRDNKSKIMIGSSRGVPIMVAPWTDSQALIVTEGIEDALSAHESTGLCAWAAGCASRLPALVETVPSWVECVTILADNDHDGRRHAASLATGLSTRNVEVRLLVLGEAKSTAA
jgi:hypothetical protein